MHGGAFAASLIISKTSLCHVYIRFPEIKIGALHISCGGILAASKLRGCINLSSLNIMKGRGAVRYARSVGDI